MTASRSLSVSDGYSIRALIAYVNNYLLIILSGSVQGNAHARVWRYKAIQDDQSCIELSTR